VINFEQIRIPAIRYDHPRGVAGGAMFTSAECHAMAEQKLAQAERDVRNRKRLIAAAEGWLFLAGKLGGAEAALSPDEAVPSSK
jgi:hypothetical protein